MILCEVTYDNDKSRCTAESSRFVAIGFSGVALPRSSSISYAACDDAMFRAGCVGAPARHAQASSRRSEGRQIRETAQLEP